MGPLWAGAAFEMAPDFKFYPFYGVPLILMVLILVSGLMVTWLHVLKSLVTMDTSCNDTSVTMDTMDGQRTKQCIYNKYII